ncbi:MAG: hypothetical protein HYZ68_05300, partial [Chloroflexi bacterium]|nr:hypothetical protein [Chloroflexota bacterium]
MQPSSRQPIYWGMGLILGSLILGGVAMALWPAGSAPWDWHGGMMGGYGLGGWGGALMMSLGMLSMAA